MDWLLPALLTVILLASWFVGGILFRQMMKDHVRRENQWELERERLLNRAMTKEWESYTQMVTALATGTPSTSPSERAVGMSDEEEMRRAGEMAANGTGVGEVFVDLSDELRELGVVD